jgi:hypothetical protein
MSEFQEEGSEYGILDQLDMAEESTNSEVPAGRLYEVTVKRLLIWRDTTWNDTTHQTIQHFTFIAALEGVSGVEN